MRFQVPPSCSAATRRRSRGLTLVETAITLGIVAALAGAAATGIRGHQERSRTSEAAAMIALMGNEIERRWDDTHQYPATLEEVFPGKRDPWGRPYHYQRIEDTSAEKPARTDAVSAPINRRFDLWSTGANGRTKPPLVEDGSGDDIVWARDGDYVGLAKEY